MDCIIALYFLAITNEIALFTFIIKFFRVMHQTHEHILCNQTPLDD